jgi:hypothetical protein
MMMPPPSAQATKTNTRIAIPMPDSSQYGRSDKCLNNFRSAGGGEGSTALCALCCGLEVIF